MTRSTTLREPEWTDNDRALVLALLAEERETCPGCGHPLSVCRDPRTAGRWQVIEEVCQPGRVAAAYAENLAEQRGASRGVHLYTRQTIPGG